jgi:hypothetical protein
VARAVVLHAVQQCVQAVQRGRKRIVALLVSLTTANATPTRLLLWRDAHMRYVCVCGCMSTAGVPAPAPVMRRWMGEWERCVGCLHLLAVFAPLLWASRRIPPMFSSLKAEST